MAVSMSTIEVFPNIDEENAVRALQEAVRSFDSASSETVLDFSSLRRIDSGALRALEDLVRAADEKSVKLVLRGVNVDVYKVLKLLKLTHRFSFTN